jgi:hypothetical protein
MAKKKIRRVPKSPPDLSSTMSAYEWESSEAEIKLRDEKAADGKTRKREDFSQAAARIVKQATEH